MNAVRLLLAEDHVDTAEVFSRLLERLGYEVETADSYRSAMDTASRSRFDVLLCDIGLPDGDGCDLLIELRKMYGLDGIAVTAYALPMDMERTAHV
jgi:CheY-like chemotaxis protein